MNTINWRHEQLFVTPFSVKVASAIAIGIVAVKQAGAALEFWCYLLFKKKVAKSKIGLL